MTGAELIMLERQRQITEEGYDQEHDDEHVPMTYGRHTVMPLLDAAASYLLAARTQVRHPQATKPGVPAGWPWLNAHWKPGAAPVLNLAKAGALIAAEIDRLQRLNEETT
jgi:hypothetical protein